MAEVSVQKSETMQIAASIEEISQTTKHQTKTVQNVYNISSGVHD